MHTKMGRPIIVFMHEDKWVSGFYWAGCGLCCFSHIQWLSQPVLTVKPSMTVSLNAPNHCDSLKEKCPLQAQTFEHLVPRWWHYWGLLWNLWKVEPCWRKFVTSGWALKLYSLALLPVLFFPPPVPHSLLFPLSICRWNVTSLLPPCQANLQFLLPQLPAMMDSIPPEL